MAEVFLVVDDQVIILDLAAEILARKGFEVITARGGREALELFAQYRCSLAGVLLDMGLPDMGGGAILKKMKEIGPEIPVLLTSGYNEADLDDAAVLQHAAGYLQKPFLSDELLDQVGAAVRRK